MEHLWPIHRAAKEKQHYCCKAKTPSHPAPQMHTRTASLPPTHTQTRHTSFSFYLSDFGKMTEKYLNLRQWLPRCSFSLCSGTRCMQSVFFFSSASCGSTETSFQFFMFFKQYVFPILFSISFTLRAQKRAVHAFLYTARVFFTCSWLWVKYSCVISVKSLQAKSHSAGKPAHWRARSFW